MKFNILKRTVSLAIAIVMLSSTFTGSAATIPQTPTEGEVQTENVQGDEIVTPSIKVTSVKNTAKGIEISWEQVDGADNYRVEVSDGAKTKLHSVQECSVVINNVKSGVTYKFVVKALNADLEDVSNLRGQVVHNFNKLEKLEKAGLKDSEEYLEIEATNAEILDMLEQVEPYTNTLIDKLKAKEMNPTNK